MAQCDFFRKGKEDFEYYCELPNGKIYDINFDKAMSLCTEYSYLKCKTYIDNTPSRICYLTTLTCEILGLPDDNFFLNQLRSLRDDYMINDMKLRSLLRQYDFIGPIIGTYLLKENNPKKVAYDLFKSRIVPISYAVFKHKYNFAVIEYLKMTSELIERYKLDKLNLAVPGEDKISLTEKIPFLGHGSVIKIK